jgi:hypothetical protein
MVHVTPFQITNATICKWFHNTNALTIDDTITNRQLGWIGNISRMETMRALRQLFASLIDHPLKAGPHTN